jgi:LysM repeat protein
MYCITYVIQPGDTLYNISRHFNVPVSAIMNANPLCNVYRLNAGETICIPVSVPGRQYTNFTTYLVGDGDTLGSVLENNDVSLADLMQLNGLSDISLEPGSTLKVPIIPGKESGVTL